jgi:hypothetical protein
MSDKDLDEQFAEIVARWDEGPAPVERPEARPDHGPEAGRELAESADAGHQPSEDEDAGEEAYEGYAAEGLGEGHVAEEPEEADTAEEHFVPGPTAPLPPQEDLHFWAIVLGMVGGPLLLLWLVLFRPGVSGWWTLLAVGLSVGGFVLLVLRQPHSRSPDDPDDGAVV